MIELKNIHKYYNPGSVNELCLFQKFSLEIPDGDFVAVVGSNGSGKTSLLNIICGTIPIDSGDIIVNGTSIVGKRISCVTEASAGYIRIRQRVPVLP